MLVLNTGSSSLKYRLLHPASGDVLAGGLAERLGDDEAVVHHTGPDGERADLPCPGASHTDALQTVLHAFDEHGPSLENLTAVGHRVVHGGSRFTEPALIDDDVCAGISGLIPLAPLHNPVNLAGIQTMRRLLPDVPQVAVFDTTFHATMPPHAATYPLPPELAQRLSIRRYGFHGTSVSYVRRRAAEALSRPVEQTNLIVCHLGNGASVTLVREGRSADTSMGFSPLEGLMMGSRVGDIDGSVGPFLQREAGMSAQGVDDLFNRGSGLKGMTGASDVRTVVERAVSGDETARLAMSIYTYRIRRYIGSYAAIEPELHGLVFTAGVGENAVGVRADVCAGLSHLGITLDPAANADAHGGAEPRVVDDGTGSVRVLVVPTDEELEIARDTMAVIGRS